MWNKFNVFSPGHRDQAKQLLLSENIKTQEELEKMPLEELENEINARYKAIRVYCDWLLVPNNKVEEFVSIIKVIGR